MTKILQDERFKESVGTVGVICGGTPCQSFSVAGLRKGLDDPRGNLALVYLGIINKLRPKWVIWENVPGVLSSNGGRDFGAFLGALGQLGYGWSYRVLDAQYFGVPQRRRRVFVVGHSSGEWQRAAAVLFEREGLSRNPFEGGKAGEGTAGFTQGGFGGYNEGFGTVRASGGDVGPGSENLIVSHKWENSNAEGSEGLPFLTASNIGKTVNNQTPLLYSIMPQNSGKDYKAKLSGVTQPLMAGGPTGGNQGGDFIVERNSSKRVRRLTPIECERLQGFPDNYTQIPYRGKSADKCPDTPRYKGLGNSMAVPVMEWLGKRIEFVESVMKGL